MKELFDLTQTIAEKELLKYKEPWEIVPHISDVIEEVISKLNKEEYNEVAEKVFVHKTCKISSTCSITGPCVICKNTELRQAAFIRGNVLVGENCVIGNSCELKNVIVFNNAQIPHFNYVGDSVIGYKAHFGAGAITSNLKSDRSLVMIKEEGKEIPTNLKKLGALVGDCSEIGCNAVLNPGTIVGKNTTIYPLTFVRGVIKENSIMKNNGEIVPKK